ncbi:MAG: outer membrane protein [Aliarcobacter sp.]
MLSSLLSIPPANAQTTSEVVTLRTAPNDSTNLTIPPTAPSLRSEDPGIVSIGAPSPLAPDQPSLTSSTSALLPTAEEPRNMDEFFGSHEGFSFRTAAGVTLQQPLSARLGNQTIYSKTVFNPGARYDFQPSYNFTDWFRLGTEAAFIYNSVHSSVFGNDTRYGTGSFYQVPLLLNATFHYVSDTPFSAYWGAGAGGAWQHLQTGTDITAYSTTNWNFVWQGTLGVNWTVIPGLDLDLGYKCLSTPNTNFNGFGPSKPLFNHTAELGLVWRF